jgi:hypothetical protein
MDNGREHPNGIYLDKTMVCKEGGHRKHLLLILLRDSCENDLPRRAETGQIRP